MQNKQTDPSDDETFGTSGDRRRPRLEDVQRLEAAVAEALGAVAAMKAEREQAEVKPWSKPQFMAQIYAMGVLAGRPVKLLRGIAEDAWRDYLGAVRGDKAPAVEDIYGTGGMTRHDAVKPTEVKAIASPGLVEPAISTSAV